MKIKKKNQQNRIEKFRELPKKGKYTIVKENGKTYFKKIK